jgi:hypothetical protein
MTKAAQAADKHTINGRLQRRHQLMQEMAAMREHLAALTNDIRALDHLLSNLGYELRELGEAATRDLALKVRQREEKDVMRNAGDCAADALLAVPVVHPTAMLSVALLALALRRQLAKGIPAIGVLLRQSYYATFV